MRKVSFIAVFVLLVTMCAMVFVSCNDNTDTTVSVSISDKSVTEIYEGQTLQLAATTSIMSSRPRLHCRAASHVLFPRKDQITRTVLLHRPPRNLRLTKQAQNHWSYIFLGRATRKTLPRQFRRRQIPIFLRLCPKRRIVTITTLL